MALGQYTGTIDEKNRSAVPKRFREELGNELIITKGIDSHLLLVGVAHWKTLLEGTEGKPFLDRNVRELQRFLLGNATEIELDSKGRYILPEYLKNYAEISGDIVYVGVGRYVEIWDKAKWEEYQTKLSEKGLIAEIADKLAERNE